MENKPPKLTPLGFFIAVLVFWFTATHVHAADYRYQQYQEPLQYQPVQTQPIPQNYVASTPTQNQTVIVNAPQPQVIVVQQPRRRYWNPIGAIMAVPRAALDIPGAILGGDEYDD